MKRLDVVKALADAFGVDEIRYVETDRFVFIEFYTPSIRNRSLMIGVNGRTIHALRDYISELFYPKVVRFDVPED